MNDTRGGKGDTRIKLYLNTQQEEKKTISKIKSKRKKKNTFQF